MIARGCARKRAFPTEQRARHCAGLIAADGGPVLRIYRCNQCACYHLTSDGPSAREIDQAWAEQCFVWTWMHSGPATA